jgi:hypothetical protein
VDLAAVRNLAVAMGCAAALAGCEGAAAKGSPVRTEAEAIAVARKALAGAPDAREPFLVQLDPIGWLVMTTPKPTASGQTRYLVRIDRHTGQANVGAYSVTRDEADEAL